MAQIINSNIASLTAQRNLNTSQSANTTALERLSSGLRINSAKDDAAGLAISTKFESQVKGLNVAIRNAGDGISLAQTAEGALGAMTENLQRIRELAVQSSNATNSDDDRVALQAEVKQLMAEVTRTAEETNFNGRNLLDGSFEGTFQIGANAGNTVEVKIQELTAEKLGTSAQAGVSSYGVGQQLGNGDLVINGEAIRASVAGDDTASFADREMSAISKAAAINASSDETGVIASANENVAIGSDMTSATTAAAATTITLNGVSIAIEGTANSNDAEKAATRGSVIAAINASAEQTGIVASDGGNDGGVVLTASDGRNITMTGGVNDMSVYGLADADTGATTTETTYGGFNLTAKNSSIDIEIQGGNGTGNGDITNSGLSAGTFTSQTAYAGNEKQNVGSADGLVALQDDATAAIGAAVDVTNAALEVGLTIGTPTGVTQALIQASFDAAGFDNITVAGNTNNDVAVAVAEAAASEKAIADGDLVINGVAIQASSSLDDTASDGSAGSSDVSASGISIAAAINKSSDQTGVSATVNETEVIGGAAPVGGAVGFGATAGAVTAGHSINLSVNGVTIQLTETADYEKNKAAAITAFNEVSGQTGVVASDNGESLTLTAADGRNISLFADAGAGIAGAASMTDVGTAIENFGLNSASVGQDTGPTTVDGFTYEGGAKTTYSTVTLSSARSFEVSVGTNGTKGLDDSGFKAGTFGGGEDGQFLKDIDISTFEGSQDAITAIDNALQAVSSQRADLGALQNRFESTSSNLQITSENLSAANSRIRDADFAAETAELSRTQVLQQAGISILAQANQRPQQVLSLLG